MNEAYPITIYQSSICMTYKSIRINCAYTDNQTDSEQENKYTGKKYYEISHIIC